MSTCSKKSSRIICICCYTFYAAGMNIKKVKWKKVHIAGWAQKSPGRGAVLREEPPRRSGDLVWICVCVVQRGDFASGGVLLCFPRGISRRSGDWASCRKSLPPFGGRPAGSCYLRFGGVPPGVVTSVWGASRRKLLPPFWGGVLPEGIPLLGEGASRSGYFVFCEMPVMRLMTKSCCSSVTTLSQ